ncbi:MAG: hypothetical protein ACTS9Y_01005 [Methylophilus sp.]|uniref:hypothetical protein n=1 Tax=Methylophilus sp. TaxID=29541 RepID=UPI003F9F91BB
MATVIKNLSQVIGILANLNMPKMNGPAVVEISKSTGRNQFLKLVSAAEDGDRRSSDSLRTICECVSEVAIQCITEIGVTQISIPKLVEIAFSEKANLFKSFINSALSSKGSDREVAINKIFDHLGLVRPAASSNGAGQRAGGSQSNVNHNSASDRVGEGKSQNQFSQKQEEPTREYRQQEQRQTNNSSQSNRSSGDRQQSGYQNNQGNDNVAHMNDYRENTADTSEGGQQKGGFESMSFFGNKFACCFNKSQKNDKEVVNIDFAEGSNRKYNWGNKVAFQCSCNEMIFVYGVLMGYIAGWISEMHGQSDIKKTLSIEKQDGGCYISINAKGMKGVKIPFAESAQLKSFLYSRIKTWFGDNNDQLIHQWIKDQCTQYHYVKPDMNQQRQNQQRQA